MRPSVDVVVPCYNYGRYLRQCVASVASQEGVEVRVLIVDNASEDDSPDIARDLAANDSRIDAITRTVNKGASASYNEGIDWAESKYFLIVDADDYLNPGALKRACDVMENNSEVSFTHGIEARLEADGTIVTYAPKSGEPDCVIIPGRHFVENLCRMPVNTIGANTVVRRTEHQKKVGYYRKALPYTDDLEMWLRLATLGDVARLNDVQATRRYHAARMSTYYQDVQERDFRERERAFESFFAHEGAAYADRARLLRAATRGLAEHAYWSGVSHLVRGKFTVGAKLLRLSHSKRPRAVLTPPLNWLTKSERPLDRAKEVISEMSISLGGRTGGR